MKIQTRITVGNPQRFQIMKYYIATKEKSIHKIELTFKQAMEFKELHPGLRHEVQASVGLAFIYLIHEEW